MRGDLEGIVENPAFAQHAKRCHNFDASTMSSSCGSASCESKATLLIAGVMHALSPITAITTWNMHMVRGSFNCEGMHARRAWVPVRLLGLARISLERGAVALDEAPHHHAEAHKARRAADHCVCVSVVMRTVDRHTMKAIICRRTRT